jgi:hypothetical protein
MIDAELMICGEQLARGDFPAGQAIGFVDLASEPSGDTPVILPPFPVVGLGERDHPLAERLDTVLEAPHRVEAVIEVAHSQPLAAMTVTHVMRMVPSLDDENALTAESLAYAVLQGSAGARAWMASRPLPLPDLPEGVVNLEREGNVLTVTMDRPQAGNAIDRAMRDGLHDAFLLANIDQEIERVVLRANGKTFSLGAELGEFGTTSDPATAHAIRYVTLPAREAIRCADRLEVVVDGACVGAGLELAAFARRITATRRSWFQLPELAMGILPGAGGCVSLSRRIGRQRALLMILSGKRISAREALEWGVIDALAD